MPAPDPATNIDATKQPDLIVAITPGQSKQETAVPLRFHHALTAIVFKMGKVEAGTTIQSISLTNLRSSGTCTFAATETEINPGEFIRDVKFTWSNLGDVRTYVQNINLDKVSQGTALTHDETTFLVVPQDITSETAVSITFTSGGATQTLTRKLNPGGSDPTIISKFLPDTKYTFTLNLAEDIQITVDDNVVGLEKKDLVIQNTGLACGWIRAVINGYWVNKNTRVIVAPWKETDGEFERVSNWSELWYEDTSTGTTIYYYRSSVPSGGFAEHLFESYKLKEDTKAPQVDAVLELNIAAQIVIDGQRSAAGWLTGYEKY